MIFYEKEVEVDNKLNNYWKITGFINNMFKPQKSSKKIRIRFYNTLALPSLNTVVKISNRTRDGRIITATEMKCVRRTEGYTWTDFETDTEIATEINITPVLDKTQEYKTKFATYTQNAL